jgi:hypothetical protein
MSDFSEALEKLRNMGSLTDKDLQALQSAVDELEGRKDGSHSYFSQFSHSTPHHTAHTHATHTGIVREAEASTVEGLDE